MDMEFFTKDISKRQNKNVKKRKKILISDFPEELERDLDWEKEKILSELGGERETDIGALDDSEYEIEVYPYQSKEEFCEKIKDAVILLTAFLPIQEDELAAAKNLEMIAVNATGFGTIDVENATNRNIIVCPIREYCTQEVAEHTMALMLATLRGLKSYEKSIEEKGNWNYLSVHGLTRMEGQTLAIFGYGRIGRAVAKRAKAFGIHVLVVDPFLTAEAVEETGAWLVTKEEALKRADIISNHMNQTASNEQYFSWTEFEKMERHPIFLNVGRGSCVLMEALVEALDSGKVRAAALDVLESENPDIKNHPLCGRENVILTPHAAFYSDTSMKELQRISCENIIAYGKGKYEKMFAPVNQPERIAKKGME